MLCCNHHRAAQPALFWARANKRRFERTYAKGLDSAMFTTDLYEDRGSPFSLEVRIFSCSTGREGSSVNFVVLRTLDDDMPPLQDFVFCATEEGMTLLLRACVRREPRVPARCRFREHPHHTLGSLAIARSFHTADHQTAGDSVLSPVTRRRALRGRVVVSAC